MKNQYSFIILLLTEKSNIVQQETKISSELR